MLAEAVGLMLICVGGGTAVKPDSATTSGDIDVWITGSKDRGYRDQVDVRISGDQGRIRLPRSTLPPVRGGKAGWFDLRNIRVSDTTIDASASVNFMNKPKVHIDRLTGIISINGMNGDFTGTCEAVDASTERKF